MIDTIETGNVRDVWVYLSTSPLLHLTLVLIAYQIGNAIYQAAGRSPLLNPVAISVILLVAMLTITNTDYDTFFEGAQFVHFLLGPATVALAVPLYRQFGKVRRHAPTLLFSIVAGSAFASASAVGMAWLLGAADDIVLAMAPKSVTAPIAMGITEQFGGLPSLTAVLVILTGIIGAALGPLAMDLARIKRWEARGFAMGTASHGIGTARALQVNEVAGAFAGIAMGLNAIATSILLPIAWRLFFG
ncbi:MAG: LrgB family protein [Pseudomonadota bacterium]